MYEAVSVNGMEQLARGLREQLQVMTAAVYTLAPHVAGNEKAEEYLAVLDRAVCTQLRLILQAELCQQLYDENEQRVSLAPVDLVELGEDVMERTDALTNSALGIRAEFTTDLDQLSTHTDQTALERLFQALVSNSVGAIGRNGTIHLALERQRDQAVFTLTDTGCGLDPKVLANLFGPEAEDESEVGPEGASDSEPEDELADVPYRGLRLARRIAQLLGGTLVAGNTEAGGARLALSLPIVDKSTSTLHSTALQADNGGWDPMLVALSGSLPTSAFLPAHTKP